MKNRGLAGTLTSRRHPQQYLALAGLALLLAPLPGCQSITGNPATSQVRIIDASPDAGGIDVYQGAGVLAYNLGLGTITSYVPITPGNYSIQVDVAGTRQLLAAQGGTFLNGAQYTVLVANYSSSLSEVILKDQTQAAPTGQISLRIIDESTRAGAIDLYFIPTGSTILTVHPYLTGVTFGQNTGYLNVPAGAYTLVALPAGTTPTATGSTYYAGAAVTYNGGVARTLVLIDQQLITTPGVQVITAADYDPIAATQ